VDGVTTAGQQTPRAAETARDVGGYRLLTKIGEGGMGVVHLAQAPDGERVALKVLRPHIVGDDEARERLAREVASLRRVTSPRIAEIIDADPYGEEPFVVTRYVPGLSLHQHVRGNGPVTGEDLSWFATGLAEAMIAVHQVGVLHRDIKPSNVLVEGRSPVLIDFGLARLAEDPRLTHTGWLLGTPGYLAPEILYGEDATTASDVHAWAATVVFAATGRPPFGTGPAMAIMDRVRRGEHDLTGVPDDLLPLVRECLAADPGDRPTTGAVLAALRGPVRPPANPRDDDYDFTMPFVLLAKDDEDDDATERVGPAADGGTKPLTTAVPTATRQEPARTPYQQPPPPSTTLTRPGLIPGDLRRPAPAGLARLQRGLLLVALAGCVMVGFAVAPYATILLAAVLALAVRTFSWTTEAARQRQHLRGRRRWYDGVLTLASSPWYLVVAAGGTLMLVAWATVVTFILGVGAALFTPPLMPALAMLGAVFGFCIWHGPGAKRFRMPTKRLIAAVTRDQWIGWTAVVMVGIVLGGLLWAVGAGEVSWVPADGAPWREGTALGDVLRWI
jgi:predicted Ser/Thr protein kinase